MATNSQVLPPPWQRAVNDTTEVTTEGSTADRTVDGAFVSFLASPPGRTNRPNHPKSRINKAGT
jgi:hypothetical protein